jgi:hypothetical protein
MDEHGLTGDRNGEAQDAKSYKDAKSQPVQEVQA